MTKNANFGPNMPFLGQTSTFLREEANVLYLHLRKPLTHLARIGFWSGMGQNGSEGLYGQKCQFDLVCLSNVVDVNRNKMIKRFLAFRTDFVQVFLFSLTSRIFRPSQILHFTANEDSFLRKENFKLLNQ